MRFFPALRLDSAKNGFTLIELLVVVSIIGLIVILGIASYNNFNDNQALNEVANSVKTNLRLAQTRAFEGVKPTDCAGQSLDGWRVNFEAASYTLVAVCDGAEIGSSEESFNLSSGVSYDLAVSSLLFLSLNRGVDISDSVSLTFSLGDKTKVVIVSSAGEVR